MTNILDDIFIKYNTDKSSLYHNYSYPYFIFFKEIQNYKLTLMEIGVQYGASIRSWYEFFLNSRIVGIDIDESCRKFSNDRISIEIGDQTDTKFLEKVNTKHGGFDIVIDDGGHTWYQQQTTFEFLFPRINPDGMYVIEDLSTSYLKGSIYDTGNPTMVEFLKRIMDDLNLNGKSTCGVKELKGKSLTLYEQWLESIFFFKGLCIIKKRKVSL